MANQSVDWQGIEGTLDEMGSMHKRALLILGRRIVPTLTSEDILQPNDYPQLNDHPEFRYEEGLLAGIQAVQMALRALKSDKSIAKM
jgi:hypothetical protein